MGNLSESTIGKLNIDTRITPLDSIREVFAKAFSFFFCREKTEQGETLTIKDDAIMLEKQKVECSVWEKELVAECYDQNKYLGDSRASQCKPDEHIVRNMSPYELLKYLKGETIQPIKGIEQSILGSGGRGCFCFSPETPVYLGERLSYSHMRIGRDISPESIQKLIDNKYWYIEDKSKIETSFTTFDFPEIENMQVVFAVKDCGVYECLEPTCAGRSGLDPCFGSLFSDKETFIYDGDNYDCEIRLGEYNDEILEVIAIEGVNVEHMSREEIFELYSCLLESREQGVSADDFLEQHPEYESRYDRSHIVTEEEYVKNYEENGYSSFSINYFGEPINYEENVNLDHPIYEDLEDWDDFDENAD